MSTVDLAVRALRDAPAPGALRSKGDRDYASDVDFTIERVVRDHLATATPEIAFLGEEEGVERRPARLLWVLDPIDGTVNFVHGLPLYAISLALVEDGDPVLGVIDIPATGTRYQAFRERGAYCNNQRLPTAQPPSHMSGAVVAIGDYAVGERAQTKNRVRLGVTAQLAPAVLRIRMLGSAAISLAWLANGWLDAAVTLSNNTWDMAAGVVLARETGHAVVDAHGERYTMRSDATISAHPDLLPELLAAIHRATPPPAASSPD